MWAGEGRDVDTSLVSGVTSGGCPGDEQFALPDLELGFAEQTGAEGTHPRGQIRVDLQQTKQRQWVDVFCARWHPLGETLLCRRVVRRLQRLDANHRGSPLL